MPEEVQLTEDDSRERSAMVMAAQAHDRWLRERDEYKRLLDQANLGLAAKNNRILQLEADLEVERNRVQNYQNERDDAVDRRIHAESRLADIKVICDREELPAPKQRSKRKRIDDVSTAPTSNGGEAVPNGSTSQGQVAGSPSVLAHGEPVLDQPTS